MNEFPHSHFEEKIRIEIAVSQIKHDFRKLFPMLEDAAWEVIDKDIENWICGDDYELEPVNDFWNFFSGITRELKLKSLLFWVTAENVRWSLESIPTSSIVLTWDFPGLEFMGKAPFRLGELTTRKEYRESKKELASESLRYAKKFPPRDHFPIVLFSDPLGGILGRSPGNYVLEGNRRAVKAFVLGEKKTTAYVGRFDGARERWPKNFWISTGFLRNIIFISDCMERYKKEEQYELTSKFFELMVNEFPMAEIQTRKRAFKNFEGNQRLFQLLTEKRKE